MNENLHTLDRLIRFFASIFLLAWAVAGGPGWTYVGLYLLYTASFSFCFVYWVLRINSTP
jgi:hypothetical protein